MNYSFDGDPRIESVITRHQALIVDKVCSVIPARYLAAIILIGGYGRSEGGYVVNNNQYVPYNDYDYFLILRNTSLRQAWKFIRSIPDLEQEVGIEVDFFPLLERNLDGLEYSLMNAEMLAGHRVIYGDSDILQNMDDMPLTGLPKSEFLRLLTNRGCLLLMNHLDSENVEYSKFVNKAWLAIGDAYFAIAGRYELSYLAKASQISEITKDSRTIECFNRAVDIRLRPDLYQPWQLADCNEVTNYWVDMFTVLSQIQVQQRDVPNFSSMFGNFLRNIVDRRLRCWDGQMFDHPRLRVNNKLLSILRDKDRPEMRDSAGALLHLWSCYS